MRRTGLRLDVLIMFSSPFHVVQGIGKFVICVQSERSIQAWRLWCTFATQICTNDMNIRHSKLPRLDAFLHILAYCCHWQESTVETSHAIAIWNFWDATWCSMNLSDSSSFTNSRSHYHWQTMRCVYVISFSCFSKNFTAWTLAGCGRFRIRRCASLSTFGLLNACVWTWQACSVRLCLIVRCNFECPALTDLFGSLVVSSHCKKQCLSGTNRPIHSCQQAPPRSSGPCDHCNGVWGPTDL